MIAKTQSRLTPREVARVLFRQRRKSALFFCATLALTWLLIAAYPRSYSSESKLFLRVGRESVALDPTATTGQTIMLQKTQLDEVNSALQILSSREVLRRTVDRLGVERILKGVHEGKTGESPTSDLQTSWIDQIGQVKAWVGDWLIVAMQKLHMSDPVTAEERAIRRLESGVRAWAPKESTIISITYAAASPQLAHDVVEAVTEVFLEQHVRLNHSEGSLLFFSEQAEKLHKELVASQTELRDRKNGFQVASIEARRMTFAEQTRDVELETLGTQRALAYSDAQIADLTRAIAGLNPELVTSRVAGFANPAKDLMREKLYELEIQESKLRSRFKPEHPELQQVVKQRKNAEEVLAGLPDDRTQTTAALNANQRQLELELAQAKATKAAQQARQTTAQKQHDALNKELLALNEQELQLTQLERTAQLLNDQYRMHVEKLEEARVNDALGRERISNIKIAQPATLVGKPSAPNKQLLLAFGFALALGGGFGLAFLFELVDQTLRTTQQVERELALPVLASFPYRKRGWRRERAAGGDSNAPSNGESSDYNAAVNGGYRALISELLHGNGFGNGHPHGKAIGVVGCETSQSRSQVAAELAIQAANRGLEPVLLIDADARHRRVAKRFHLNGSPGWREVLAGVADAESCVHRSKSSNLAVMTAGGENGDAPSSKSVSGSLAQLDEIKADYGLVVVDLPTPIELDPPAAAGWLDEMVLVVEAERTRIQSAQRAKEVLERAGVRLAGVVLANRREHIPRWLYQRL